MFKDNQNGYCYTGDMHQGDREATPEEIEVYELSKQPTPLEQIRALEQAHEGDQRKLTRISILELALDKSCANPSMAGKTRAEVHAAYYAISRGYRELFDLEQQCAALRKQIV